jgi:hypothetical protein
VLLCLDACVVSLFVVAFTAASLTKELAIVLVSALSSGSITTAAAAAAAVAACASGTDLQSLRLEHDTDRFCTGSASPVAATLLLESGAAAAVQKLLTTSPAAGTRALAALIARDSTGTCLAPRAT